MIFSTLFGSLIFSAAFSFRHSADAAEQAPLFVTVVTVFRLLSYGWLGCIIAPLNWALRHVAIYIAMVLLFDILLLAYSFGLVGGGALLAPPRFRLGRVASDGIAVARLAGFCISPIAVGSVQGGGRDDAVVWAGGGVGLTGHRVLARFQSCRVTEASPALR